MKDLIYTVRNAQQQEFKAIGHLMTKAYSQLQGFPKPDEQPRYYEMLANIGDLTKKPNTELLVAVSETGEINAAVVYFSDMKQYGSGGTAVKEKQTSGFRLLAVDPNARGRGLGKLLTKSCIEKATKSENKQLIIHSTESMKIARKIYKNLGFKRSEDLDFMQGALPVFGFRLKVK